MDGCVQCALGSKSNNMGAMSMCRKALPPYFLRNFPKTKFKVLKLLAVTIIFYTDNAILNC